MNNNEKIKVLDELGNEKEATILNILEVDNQEYLLYSIPENNEDDGIYAMKIITTPSGEKDLKIIDNEEEKKKVFESLNKVLDEIE